MISTEILTDESKELFACIYLNVKAEVWIESDHPAISILSCILKCYLKFQCCLASTVFKCCFVRNLSFIKVSFVTGQVWNALVGHWWKFLDNWRWVVGFFDVYIEVYYSVSWKERIFQYVNWRRHLKTLSQWGSYQLW